MLLAGATLVTRGPPSGAAFLRCWHIRARGPVESACGRGFPKHAVHTRSEIVQKVEEITTISVNHLTPAIKLHLITPDCPLWTADPASCPFPDPYWAFYWPGGQAITRFILDHPDTVAGRSVLDVGCGCGSGAIAAALAGATTATANDIDPVALVAARMNASANGVVLSYSQEDYIGRISSCLLDKYDVVLLGDMLYSSEFAATVFHWAASLARRGKHVYIGDPGRDYVRNWLHERAHVAMTYELPDSCKKENSGFVDAAVLQLLPRS